MPRHMEQPAFRHWKPASWKISWSPSASAARATSCDPGTISARTPRATFRPRAISAATLRSDRRPFVQDPMKATSTLVPAIGWPALKPMN